jgi:hypothetical protein
MIRNQQVRGSNPRVGSASTEIRKYRLTVKLTGSFLDSNMHHEYILRIQLVYDSRKRGCAVLVN